MKKLNDLNDLDLNDLNDRFFIIFPLSSAVYSTSAGNLYIKSSISHYFTITYSTFTKESWGKSLLSA